MRLGAPIFLKSEDPRDLAREHLRLGYGAAYCPPLQLNEPERIRATRDAFAAAGVVIAEVGAWKNLLAADPTERRANFEYVRDRLALADEVGARCCVDIAGSHNPTSGHGPDARDLSSVGFAEIVENARQLIDDVRPTRTKFVLEMMPWTLPDSPDSFLELIRAVDRPAFGVHLDPVNIVNSPRRYFDTAGLLRECFAKLGPLVVSCHAKDIIMGTTLVVHLDEIRPGLGVLDYRVFLAELARLPSDTTLMVEHQPSAEEYDLAAAHIRDVAAENGLAFEQGQAGMLAGR